MDYKTKKRDDSTVQITVKFSGEEVDQAYQQAYLKARQKFKLPGFRQGKVPLDLVEKHLGDAVAEEAARELISTTLRDIVEDLSPTPISIPRFDIESFDRQKGALFKGSYDTMPEVKLGKHKKLKVAEDQPTVDEKNIDEELERLRTERAVLRTKEDEPIETEDRIKLKIVVREGEKRLFKNDSLQVQLGRTATLPGMDEKLVGMKTGEERTFDLAIDEDFPDDSYAGKTVTVEAELLEAQVAEKPELNDEFAKDLGEFETLTELRAKIRENLTEQARSVLRGRAMQQLVEQLVADSKLTIPASMIDSEYDHRLEQIGRRAGLKKGGGIEELARAAGKDRESLEKELREGAERSVRDRLVMSELARTTGVSASPEDITAEIQERYGSMLPPEQLRRFLEDDEVREDVQGRMLYRKALEWLYENADVKKGQDVSYEALKAEGAFD